jgi:hypothetical protein
MENDFRLPSLVSLHLYGFDAFLPKFSIRPSSLKTLIIEECEMETLSDTLDLIRGQENPLLQLEMRDIFYGTSLPFGDLLKGLVYLQFFSFVGAYVDPLDGENLTLSALPVSLRALRFQVMPETVNAMNALLEPLAHVRSTHPALRRIELLLDDPEDGGIRFLDLEEELKGVMEVARQTGVLLEISIGVGKGARVLTSG